MALVEDMLEGSLGPVAVVGAVLLAPTMLPVVGRVLRPVAKTAIKTGMMLYRETMGGLGEVTGDLVAEARAELDEEGRSTPRRAHQPAKTPA